MGGGFAGCRKRRDNWVRDYDETWRYPDREVSRRETGSPVRIGADMFQGSLGYSIANGGRYFFSARVNLDRNHVPAKEEGDRRTVLYTSEQDRPVAIYEHTRENSISPSLDLYFQRSLGGGRQLTFDIVGTYIGTDSRRIYRESAMAAGGMGYDGNQVEDYGGRTAMGGILPEVVSDVSGDRYSLIAEGIYEQPLGSGRLSAGLRHMQAYTRNEYRGTAVARPPAALGHTYYIQIPQPRQQL